MCRRLPWFVHEEKKWNRNRKRKRKRKRKTKILEGNAQIWAGGRSEERPTVGYA